MASRISRRVTLAATGVLALAASGSAPGQDNAAPTEPDIMIMAGKLRQVQIVYDEKRNDLGQCKVRVGKEARIIDQMMCSLLKSCIADGWDGMQRATKCLNARVNALELQAQQGKTVPGASPFPDQWLAQGYEKAPARDADELPPIADAAIRPGWWVFTELAVGRTSTGTTPPSMMRWRTCIAPSLGDRSLSRLLAPPPYTETLRIAVPPDCRRWAIRAADGALSGSMACRTPGGATSSGKVEGRFSSDRLILRRERHWRKDDAWAEATFNTSATREGSCGA